MEFERKAIKYLLGWKNSPYRKPLLVRGARQVGKSTLIRQLKPHYRQFIELNLERHEHWSLFQEIEGFPDLVNAIFLQANYSPQSNTLIFIDEIQESPKAIQLLRYFHEDYPHLHVIAAGSLLEFALQELPSFPVGRVEQFKLHPFDFEEFLMAYGQDQALEMLNTIPLPTYAHLTLQKLFHQFMVVGGMPEAVKRFVQDGHYSNLPDLYDSLWQSYRDDVEKYASTPSQRQIIRHVIATAPYQLDRITFSGFGNSNYKSREIAEALRALDLSGIVQLMYPSTNTSLPASPNYKRKPRLQFLDTGLLSHALGIQQTMIGGAKGVDSGVQGQVMHHWVVQELKAQHSSTNYQPLFWVREKKGSNAEVDLIHATSQFMIPIEVKSGSAGRLRSLHQFIEQAPHQYAVRVLGNQLSLEETHTAAKSKDFTLLNLPYYLSCKIPEYVDWLLRQSAS